MKNTKNTSCIPAILSLIFIPLIALGQSSQNNYYDDIDSSVRYIIIDSNSDAIKDIVIDFDKKFQMAAVLDAAANKSAYELSAHGKELIKNLAIELLAENKTSIVVTRSNNENENLRLADLRMAEIEKEFAKYGIMVIPEINSQTDDLEQKISIKLLVKD
jgi:hypothetical protein